MREATNALSAYFSKLCIHISNVNPLIKHKKIICEMRNNYSFTESSNRFTLHACFFK